MRYPKGSIVISESLDFPLLLLVRNARYISFRQLRILLQYGDTELAGDRLGWRLDRLARAEYIRLLEQRVQGEKIYSIAHKGLSYLEMMGHGVLSLLAKRRRLLDPALMMHALELTEIRIVFRDAGVLQLWKTDVEVSSENIATGEQYAKDYDAIATLAIQGKVQQFAIEYERSTKAFARYRELRAILGEEQKLAGILYFIFGVERFMTVVEELEGAHPRLIFCNAEEFRSRRLNAYCLRFSSEPMIPLARALGTNRTVVAGGGS
jgi:hypothetical protein